MDASSFLKRGIEYFEKGDYDNAITDTSESIKLNPNDAIAYGTRGAAYKGKKDFDSAVMDFNEAIRLDPNNAPAYGNRGLTYLAKGDKDQAILDLEMAVKLDPQNAGYRKFLNDIKSSGGSTKSVETLKKEIKVIHIGAIIGFVVVSICFAVSNVSLYYSEPLVAIFTTIIAGAWAGFGVGGNIALIPSLFKAGGFLFGWWDSKSTFMQNIFGSLIGAFIGWCLVIAGLSAFILAGPVWPLIRISMRKSQIKKMKI